MARKPRVLQAAWNLIRGGTEGQCARTSLGLAHRGFDCRVAVFRREGFFLDTVEQACGPVLDIGIQRFMGLDTWRKVRWLAGILREESIELVHTWDADAAIFVTRAAELAGVPFITSRRDLGAIYPFHKDLLLKRADRRAARVVINAERIRPFVLGEGVDPESVVRIPNILDLEEFDRLALKPFAASANLPDGLFAVMVSRLDPEKDGLGVIRAFAQASARMPGWSLVIAGDGPDRPAMEQACCRTGLQERVMFLGDIPDVPALLSRASLGILLPKGNEGLSNTILEYLGAGLPVVATDCGGNAELVHDGVNGYVVPCENPAAAAEAMVRLAASADLRATMGSKGRAMAVQDYAPDSVLQRFEELYCAMV